MGIVRARDDSCNNAPVRRGSRTGHRYEPARDRGTRGDGAGQRRRTRGRPRPGGGCMPEGWMPLVGAGPHPPAGRRLTVAVYETATARGATVIIPPAKTANIWVYPGFPTIFRGLSEFFVGDLMGKALWKLVENAQRFPRRGGRVLCVHGPVSFHRARPCATKWPPRRGLRTGPPASSDCGRP